MSVGLEEETQEVPRITEEQERGIPSYSNYLKSQKNEPTEVIQTLGGLRELDEEETEILKKIADNIYRFREEATKKWGGKEWTKANGLMAELFDSFESWDGAIIDGLKEVFDHRIEVLTNSRGNVQGFLNNWNGWVSEAGLRRQFRSLEIGELLYSDKMDLKEIDAKAILVEMEGEKYKFIHVYFQAKSTVKEGATPEINFFDLNNLSPSEQIQVQKFLSKGKQTSMQEGGLAYEYARKEALEHSQRLIDKNYRRGVRPENVKTYMAFVLATAGMNPQDVDYPYGWMEFMKRVEIDSDIGGPMFIRNRDQLLDIVDRSNRIDDGK